MKNLDRLFFRFVTISSRLTDRQTDGRTEYSSLDRVCIPCSSVKNRSCRDRRSWRQFYGTKL